MTAETIATFTRKIVASNRSELICVLYEIYFSYEQEAIEALTGEGKRGRRYLYQGFAPMRTGGQTLKGCLRFFL